MLHLDSELLRTFLAVVETGNITRAAGIVGRTQSAVSTQIKRLEAAVGSPLFVREARGVRLTRRGDELVADARRIVTLIDETAARLSAPPLDGPVRIGIPEEYGQSVLSRALAAFSKRHHNVEVSARYGCSSDHVAEVRSGGLDLAVVFEWQDFSGGEVLMNDPTVWVTSRALSVHEERPLPIALYEDEAWCRDFALRSLRRRGIDYRIAYRSDTCGGLKLAVQSGLAVAPISRSNIAPDCRELTEADGFGDIDQSNVVLHRNPASTSAAVDGMVDAIREAFQTMRRT
ncbi:MAG: LysR family transcriptional regulator [Rhizobiaceae bacterium]|nr:LysR family transcriptional regulator [Rhizobiaceae bacterium]MCV0408553.1 LysR family transcriptional regulator [Rhizobiaceae bacterium]